MKRSIIYSVFAALLFFACRKDDNVKVPDLLRVPVPLLVKDATGDQVISAQEPDKFKGKFVVDLFFKTDVPPQKFDAVVIKNGDKSKVLTLKEGITTYPTTVEITGPQLASLFGTAIKLGDNFDIGVDITLSNGQKYLAFPSVGVPYGTGIANQPGASTQLRFSSVCPFNINDFLGNATIEDPDFWGATYPVTVTLQGTDTYKISGWVEEPTYYILAKVNIGAQTVAVASRVYGPTLPGTPYTNPNTEGTGVIDACGKKIVMTLSNSVNQGSFGSSTIILKK